MSISDLRAYLGSTLEGQGIPIDVLRPLDGAVQWFDETRRDLQWRIQRMRNEERQPPPSPPSLTVDFSGQLLLPRASPPPPPPPGPVDAQLPSVTLAFSSEEEAKRAGAAREFTATETETPREIDGKVENLLWESTDPAFAAAFVNSLGADGLWRIVRDGEQPEAALAAIHQRRRPARPRRAGRALPLRPLEDDGPARPVVPRPESGGGPQCPARAPRPAGAGHRHDGRRRLAWGARLVGTGPGPGRRDPHRHRPGAQRRGPSSGSSSRWTTRR
jgi:hypothetical protein